MMTDDPALFAHAGEPGTPAARQVARVSIPSRVPGVLPVVRTALAAHLDWREAMGRVIQATMSGASGPPDLVVVFVGSAWAGDFPQLIANVRAATCAATIVGCSTNGAMANGCEVEAAPAISMLAGWLPGTRIRPVRLTQEHLVMLGGPDDWAPWADLDPDDVRSWLVFSEPFRFDVQALLASLDERFPGVPVMGGLTSGRREERTGWVFFDGQVYDEGAVALAIGGDCCMLPMVAHGCDPIGEAWTVTGAERNVLSTISNRPALTVLRDSLATLPAGRREAAERNLVLGFASDEYRDDFHRGDFLLRGILGVDEGDGTLTVGGLPRIGQTVQFHVRDSESATIDLMQSLTDLQARVGGRRPVGGILFDCVSRGMALFDEPHHGSGIIRAALGDVPVMGGFVGGEIGPAGKRHSLHAFTSTLALLVHDPREGNEHAGEA
jgi:small ligand-binding sensory domain FIST